MARKRPTVTTTLDIAYKTSPVTLQANLRRPSSGAGPWPVVLIVDYDGLQDSSRTEQATNAIRIVEEEAMATLCIEIRERPYVAPDPEDDIAAAVEWIVANAATYNLDANNIGVMGGSGGGHIAASLATKWRLGSGDTARVKCAVLGSAPTTLDLMSADGVDANGAANCELYVGVPLAGNLAAWQAASPYYHVGSDCAPILQAHSSGDQVPYAQAPRLKAALDAAGVPNKLITRSGTTHGWVLLEVSTIWAEAMAWLNHYLR